MITYLSWHVHNLLRVVDSKRFACQEPHDKWPCDSQARRIISTFRVALPAPLLHARQRKQPPSNGLLWTLCEASPLRSLAKSALVGRTSTNHELPIRSGKENRPCAGLMGKKQQVQKPSSKSATLLGRSSKQMFLDLGQVRITMKLQHAPLQHTAPAGHWFQRCCNCCVLVVCRCLCAAEGF